MIIRTTQKLAKKIKVVPVAALPPHDNPLLDWTANLFMISRSQCIILTNSANLYSVVFPGKGVPNGRTFVEQSMKALRDNMALDGITDIFDTMVAPAWDSVNFCKTGDRRVLGSMNDLIYQAKGYLLEVGLPLPLANMRLNETPMTMLEHHNPKMSLLALAGQKTR